MNKIGTKNLFIKPATKSSSENIFINGQELPEYLGHPVIPVGLASAFKLKDFRDVNAYYLADGSSVEIIGEPLFYNDYSIYISNGINGKPQIQASLRGIPSSLTFQTDKKEYFGFYKEAFNAKREELATLGFTKLPECLYLYTGEEKTLFALLIVGEMNVKTIKELADNLKYLFRCVDHEAERLLAKQAIKN